MDDETNPELCTAAVNTQTTKSSAECFAKSVFIYTSNNSAGVSGSNLFGGLLDRCLVDNKSHSEQKTGVTSFLHSSNVQIDSISSHPVQLCFCRDGHPDCNYQPESIQVNRGNIFTIDLELIAFDQVHHAVNTSVHFSFNSSVRLGEGEQNQNINRSCTKLEYSLFSPNKYNRVTLNFSAERDPCDEISKKMVMVENICSCPIGFQETSRNNKVIMCDCVCDHELQSHGLECNLTSESIVRKGDIWISYINHTRSNLSGFIIHPHCPLDYCYGPNELVNINLNLPNGSDAQCAHDRMGTLCGTCKPGLSVSLGSSKCLSCHNYWPGLLVTIIIVFIISGIGLVAFLLALNLTVAIGTINAIIFYADIVAANKSALFPSGVSPASVFISWLNLDIGFDVCIFDGLDTYVKTWLQLAFPAYIIILVVVIIQLSYYFDAFGHFVGKKDPVATLATLILLSYTKFLKVIIKAFSSATLVYPDGSKKSLWLPDATVEYFSSKHIVLFFVAILILLAGLVYTLLLVLWQWLLCCPRKCSKRIRYQKLNSLMDIYRNPYTLKHRYWTGLLLLARVCIYLVSAFNPSGDPRVTLSTTNFVMTSLIIYIAMFGVKLYKNSFINTMETLTYFNIMALSMFSLYTIDADTNQTTITDISVSITFIQLIIVIIYHVYKHMHQKVFVTIQAFYIKIKKTLAFMIKKQRRSNYQPPSADENTNQFHELLDFLDHPFNTIDDRSTPLLHTKPDEPTRSFLELPNFQVIDPDTPQPPLEATEEESVGENLPMDTYVNEHVQNISGIEREEFCETGRSHDSETDITNKKENLKSKLHCNSEINNCPPTVSDIEQANEEALALNNLAENSLPADGRQQDELGSQCNLTEVEVHEHQ